MGTHVRVLRKSYPMNTNMTGFRLFSKNRCVLVLWGKVVLALEVLKALQYSVAGLVFLRLSAAAFAAGSTFKHRHGFCNIYPIHARAFRYTLVIRTILEIFASELLVEN